MTSAERFDHIRELFHPTTMQDWEEIFATLQEYRNNSEILSLPLLYKTPKSDNGLPW